MYALPPETYRLLPHKTSVLKGAGDKKSQENKKTTQGSLSEFSKDKIENCN